MELKVKIYNSGKWSETRNNLSNSIFRGRGEINHKSDVGMCKMGETCLNLGMKAKKFNIVKGPGKHFHSSSSCCLGGMGKYGVNPNEVFVVYKPLTVLQER